MEGYHYIEDAEQVKRVMERVSLPEKRFVVKQEGGLCFLHLEYEEEDVETGEMKTWPTRRWLVELPCVVDDVLRTAYKCAVGSAEHQVGEHFLFEGERVFNPHNPILRRGED